MIDVIKEKLLEEPTRIKDLLELYGYHHIVIRPTYITFGREEGSSPKSLVMKLCDNQALIVKDYAKNITLDVFNLIIKQKKDTFKNVINAAKNSVGIDGLYYHEEKHKVFGGFYAKIKNRAKQEMQIYDESILNKYQSCGNLRFLQDGISLEVQRRFNIGYDVKNQSITIPIRNEFGSLIGVKCRRNEDVMDGCQKYWYDVPCQMSQALYGYAENYEHLESADNVYIYESEKSVMQNLSMGCKSVVALGNSDLSKKQAQLLLSLNARNYVFMMDKGLEFSIIEKNIQTLKVYGKMKEFGIKYWVPGEDVPNKASASDLNKRRFEKALEKELVECEKESECA